MKLRVTRKQAVYFTALVAPLVLSNILLPFRNSLPPRENELLFIISVAAIAALGNRTAAVIAALGGAVWYDFFFIPPYQHFSPTTPADAITAVLMVAIGWAVAELSFQHRRLRASTSSGTEYLTRIHGCARVVQSSARADSVLEVVQRHLTQMLTLQECKFVYDVEPGRQARIAEDGSIMIGGRTWDSHELGMPDQQIELPVFVSGIYKGRFVLTPTPETRAPLQARLTALTLADQAAVALGRPRAGV